MRVDLLGPLRVRDSDGAERPVPAGLRRALLTRLAVDADRLVPTDALIHALWPEGPPANAAGALQTQVSRLRKVLGDHLRGESGGYRLSGCAVDTAAFDTLAGGADAAAGDGDPHESARLAREALSLWRGPALADAAGLPFADAEAVRLTARRDAVETRLAEARQAIEGPDAVLAELTARHAADPLDEAAAARRMRALAASGRQAEALDVYEQTRARLADELGVDPSPALADAHLDVLRGIDTPAPALAESRLPEPLTACIGRDDDIEAVLALMAASRLVTLTGPGGTGKTRLALECARRLERDGRVVRLAELAPVTDGDRLPDALLDALGRGESILARHRKDPVERLTAAVRHRDTVLVVDNCEHLVDEIALLLSRCLARAPRLRVLATSREALGIFGETVRPVGPLPPAQTVRLFAERAAASVPGAALTDADAAVIGDLCAALDGLPLAIELAAARLRTMSLDDLAARIHDRFALLNRGDRTAAPRQRSLRGVVDWSWDLLDTDARRLLARMSVFNGGFDLPAAEAVCGADVDAVADLVDKSLVQRFPEGRYRLLETVREYAAERLDELGETAALQAAHADHYAELAQEASPHLVRAEQVEWLDRLAADHGNLTAAVRRMIAAGDAERAHRLYTPLSWYWWMRGHRREGQLLGAEVKAMSGAVAPTHRAMIGLAGTWGLWSGVVDPAEAVASFKAAADLVERHDLAGEEPLLKMLPVLLALIDDDESGIRRALDDLDPVSDAWVRGMALLFASEYAYRAGRTEQGLAEITESHAVFEAIGERFGIIMSLQGLAAARTEAGDHKEARRLVARALRIEAELGADASDSVIAEHLWRLDAEHDDDPAAVLARLRREAERLSNEHGDNENVVAARIAAAICLRRLGRLAEARDELLLAESQRPRFVRFSEVSVRLYEQLRRVAEDLGDRDLSGRAAEVLDGLPETPLNW